MDEMCNVQLSGILSNHPLIQIKQSAGVNHMNKSTDKFVW